MSKFARFSSKLKTPPTEDNPNSFKLFNKVSDQNLFNSIDHELIKLGGSPLIVHKYYHTSDPDNVYGEDRGKVIAQTGIVVYGHYEPRAIEENLTQFGIEITNDQQFTFNKSYVEAKLGRLPIAGDVIKPVFQNLKYEIFEVQEDSFEMYGVYHIVCTARLLRDAQDVHNQQVATPDSFKTRVTDEDPNDKIS